MAQHNIFGKEGEKAACETLLKKGYIIREQNWRVGKDEIDIVAEKGNRIIIVEVKTRSHKIDDVSKVITKQKIQHLVKAGKAYLNFYGLPHQLQFDIMLLTGSDINNLSVEHIEDAIMPPMRTYR